ncbi:hypothetical protein BDV96DRAFT_654378 [Lophiotrema nucula]|uniref:RING-type domain-containing protein n=1 Tax=Lophiotrema nucula TaxID=690887 RepID=A0A6A5YKF1_9PLEO|nr:hypothetical protein BDV96DRAFT_654378 [Lophiotrema nucula]
MSPSQDEPQPTPVQLNTLDPRHPYYGDYTYYKSLQESGYHGPFPFLTNALGRSVEKHWTEVIWTLAAVIDTAFDALLVYRLLSIYDLGVACGVEAYKFIITSAIHRDVEDHENAKDIVETMHGEYFQQLLSGEEEPDFRPATLEDIIKIWSDDDEVEEESVELEIFEAKSERFELLEDVPLTLYGPLIAISDFSTLILMLNEETCTICQEDVVDENCCELHACNHQLHKGCIGCWANSQTKHVRCPVCRREVCTPRASGPEFGNGDEDELDEDGLDEIGPWTVHFTDYVEAGLQVIDGIDPVEQLLENLQALCV